MSFLLKLKKMHHISLAFGFLVFVAIHVRSQDTIPSYFATQFHPAKTVEEMKNFRAMDSLPEFGLYAFADNNNGDWFLFQKKGKGWEGWNIFENSEQRPSYWPSLKMDTVLLDNQGRWGILLEWNDLAGHSSWDGGFAESRSGIQVWDIEKKLRLVDLQVSCSYETWSTYWDPPLDEVENPEESTSTSTREITESITREIKIEKGILFLGKTEVPDDAPEYCEGNDLPGGYYHLEGNFFVKKD
jgi:hypothetical protein